MNERDKEIREKAWALVSDEERERNELYETRERWERCDQKFADLIRADEREACAKVCDDFEHQNWEYLEGATLCAAAIRARGNT